MTSRHGTSLQNTRDTPAQFKRRGLTITEMIIVIIIVGLLVVFLLPIALPRNAREAARRTQCKNNLKQISLALWNYQSTYDAFPPAYTVDDGGKPLHSWRTLILPYLDQQPLYDTIDLSKPWNDPVNSKAFKTKLTVFSCPSTVCPENCTTYLGIVATNGLFRTSIPRLASEITDGTSNTLMVIEVAPERAVHWMTPVDADEPLVVDLRSNSKRPHSGGTHAAMADGSVRFLSSNISIEQLRALISIAGNDQVGDF